MFTMMSIMMLISAMFLAFNHPLSMGLMLLSQTIMIALTIGMINPTFWFSYVLFLIMIGGMLILLYMKTSVASNEKFKFSMKIVIMNSIIIIIILMMWLMDFNYFYELINLEENLTMIKSMYFTQSMNKYLNYPNNIILYIMFFYLFITLIMVTKITKLKSGPLRQKN
uniref:NADH-ubiquinone oxidoreductase chain 6 n=1 Tax=Crioceris duodecimpunctata TaxID=184539 RepID=Q8WB11_CRIDU|nr:NADH dehydrogenase subunit 6 [Crioceris duodecimpunctata]AAL67871.1 NADH dehydrogenase subunit 6 [Crioceris duodecimpunctata]